MSRIADLFAGRDRPVFVGFTVAGDPDPETSVAIAETLVDAGVDLLELGIPFSDPVADGPTIQRAHDRALRAGMTPSGVFSLVRAIRAHSAVPIVLFTYYNVVYRRGPERFFAEAAAAGAGGVLIVDLPVEEADEAAIPAARADVDLIFLIAPTTSPARRRVILSRASGFVYLISLEGVTGAREALPENVDAFIRSVRRETALPLAVGFGISRPEHVRAVAAAGADAAVVGSAIVRVIERNLGDTAAMLREVRAYAAAMAGSRSPGEGYTAEGQTY